MRLAILADIHGNLVALEAVLADLASRAPDAIVNLGDCATSPLWPCETLELLDTLAWPTVRGNHDRWLAELPVERRSSSVMYAHAQLGAARCAALGALPPSLRIGDDILAVHGTPASDMEYLLEQNVDGRLALVGHDTLRERVGDTTAGLVLCGHSHLQHMAYLPERRLVVNPGSVGCPRYADNPDPFVAEAGAPYAHYAIATSRAGRWSVDMIALAYDWSTVTARARSNGRDDWARGFLGDPHAWP